MSRWFLLFIATIAFASQTYLSSIREWRHQREAALLADDGWLTVVGLSWLHEGTNTFGTSPSNDIVLPKESAGAHVGVFRLQAGRVTVQLGGGPVQSMRPDTSGSPDLLHLGSLTMYVIRRGSRYGIRLKDKNSKFRRDFSGLRHFPVSESYRITARFVSSPEKIPILNVIGQTGYESCPGYAVFRLHGRELRLYPILETPDSKSLFFVFRDLTSGKETYGAGRFLDTEPPKDGKVVLDFNKAYNPPCAFTPYATCPLPPKQNRLPVAIDAGEMKYTGPH